MNLENSRLVEENTGICVCILVAGFVVHTTSPAHASHSHTTPSPTLHPLSPHSDLHQTVDMLHETMEKSNISLQEREEELTEKEKELQAKVSELREKERELQEKVSELREKEGQLQEKEGQLQEKEGQLQEKEGQLEEKGRELSEANKKVGKRRTCVVCMLVQTIMVQLSLPPMPQIYTLYTQIVSMEETLEQRPDLDIAEYERMKRSEFDSMKLLSQH